MNFQKILDGNVLDNAPRTVLIQLFCFTSFQQSIRKVWNFTCLTVLATPLSYSIWWEYWSGHLSRSGLPGGSGQPGHNLHNFQFYLAHLWTDFQSCFCMTISVRSKTEQQSDNEKSGLVYSWATIVWEQPINVKQSQDDKKKVKLATITREDENHCQGFPRWTEIDVLVRIPKLLCNVLHRLTRNGP